jgi:hypothetical protein
VTLWNKESCNFYSLVRLSLNCLKWETCLALSKFEHILDKPLIGIRISWEVRSCDKNVEMGGNNGWSCRRVLFLCYLRIQCLLHIRCMDHHWEGTEQQSKLEAWIGGVLHLLFFNRGLQQRGSGLLVFRSASCPSSTFSLILAHLCPAHAKKEINLS